MTKDQFIEAWNFLEEILDRNLLEFMQGKGKNTGEVFFTCLLINNVFGMKGSLAYKEIMGSYNIPSFSTGEEDQIISIKRSNTQRLVALELFYTICLEEKLYEQF